MRTVFMHDRQKKRLTVLLAALLCLALAGGTVAALLGIINAGPLSYVLSNYPPPGPAPAVFGPDQAAWSHLQDHPGHDTAYTAARSRAFTGDTSPNHVYLGSNALMFQGYDSQPRLDYVFAEDYTRFDSVSFTLRPVELSMHALSQSGFFFNGKIEAGNLYTGYALMLESTVNDDCTNPGTLYANLRLYYLENACLDDASEFAKADKTLVSTYAVNLSSQDVWPINVRVENDETGRFQVFIDGELRTRDLNPMSAAPGFGFFSGYGDHDCAELTVIAFSNLQIAAKWVQRSAKATVHFIDKSTGLPLAGPETISGVTGQYYAINMPDFPGYYRVEANQKLLDPIPYFGCDGTGDCDCNETILYYTPKSPDGVYKEASYEGAPNNGTAKNPVPVEPPNPNKHIIDYSVHAGGNGQWHYGDFVTSTVSGQGTVSMGGFGDPVAWEDASPNNNYGQGGQNNAIDVALDPPSTNKSGNMTIDSNYPIQIGKIQTPASASGSGTNNDGVVVGYRPAGSGAPLGGGKLYTTGQKEAGMLEIPHSPACAHTGNGNNVTHTYIAATRAAHPGALASCGCSVGNAVPKEERYIKLTFNNLRNDAGYVFDFFLGDWDMANPEDYIIKFIGNDSLGKPLSSPVVQRPASGLFSPNSGNSIGVTPVEDFLPAPADYTEVSTGGGNGYSYIYPIDGKIEVIFTKLHNALHCHNLIIGAGQSFARYRQTVVSVIDYLPPGTTYVPGSAGVYEANLVDQNGNPLPRDAQGKPIIPVVNGGQYLRFDFGVLPPEGYDIPIQVTIDREGLFINHGRVNYGAGIPLTSTDTNNTYHQTGEMVGVTEHFLDYNNNSAPHAALKGDRFISMPPGEDYTTSVVSLADILYDGETYRYVGYKRIGIDSEIQLGVPPDPTIPGVTKPEEIDLYFAKNPRVRVEFREWVENDEANRENWTVLKDEMTFPVHFGDPFFLPDSAREPIWYDDDGDGPNVGQWYNYIAYAKTKDGTLLPIEYDVPGKPIFPVVNDDEDIVVYFTNKLAVTVRYVEYGSPRNVLKNNDYFLVGVGGDFSVEPWMMGPIVSVGKRYVYEGYSIPDPNDPDPEVQKVGTFVPGAPPDPAFGNMQENKEIILHFSTVYLITLKYHENIPYADGVVYDELLPVVTLTVKAGESFSLDGQALIYYGGDTYDYINQFKWDTDSRPINSGPPYIEAVYGDYTIIYLYEKDELAETNADHSVLVMYREYGYTAHVLDDDVLHTVPEGGSFSVGAPGAPSFPLTFTDGGVTYKYYAYQIDRGAVIVGNPDNPTFTDVTGNHEIMLQYIPDGNILERFRQLGRESNILLADQLAANYSGGIYTPESWVPPAVITIDAYHVYTYHGYRVDGGLTVQGNPPASLPVGTEITYLYEYEFSDDMGGAMFAKADAEANETAPGWEGGFADPAALEALLDRLSGAKFRVYPDVGGKPGPNPLRFEEGAGADSYLYNTTGGITEITTGGSGIFMLYGFPVAGITCWIVETGPPEGYLPEEAPYAFVVTANGTAPGCHALFDELIPEPLPYALGAEKTAVGKNLAVNQFRFELWLSDEEGGALELLDSKANAIAGESSPVDFDTIVYERSGVHYYLVKELAPAKAQEYWSLDETVYLVKVELSSSGGILTPAVTYIDLAQYTFQGENNWEDYEDGANRPEFVNTYDPPTCDIALDKLSDGQPVLAWLAGRGLTGAAVDAVLDGMSFSLYRAPENGGAIAPGDLVLDGVKLDADGRLSFQGVTPGWYAVIETLTGMAAQVFAQAEPLYIYVGPGGIMSSVGLANMAGQYSVEHTPGYNLDVKIIYEDGCELFGVKPDGSGQQFCTEKFDTLLPDGTRALSLCADLGAHNVYGGYLFDELRHGFSDAQILRLVAMLDYINDDIPGGLDTLHGRALAQIVVWNMILRVNGDAGFAEAWPHSGSGTHDPDAKAVKVEGYGTWYDEYAALIDDMLDDTQSYVETYLTKTGSWPVEDDYVTGVAFLVGDGVGYTPIDQQRQILVQFGRGVAFENDPYSTASVVIEGEKIVEGGDAPAQDFEFLLLWVDEHGNEVVGPPPFVMPGENPITVSTAGAEGSPYPVVFEAIELPPGVYYFKIVETDGGKLGWTYDLAERLICVTVDEDGKTTVASSVSFYTAPAPGIAYSDGNWLRAEHNATPGHNPGHPNAYPEGELFYWYIRDYMDPTAFFDWGEMPALYLEDEHGNILIGSLYCAYQGMNQQMGSNKYRPFNPADTTTFRASKARWVVGNGFWASGKPVWQSDYVYTWQGVNNLEWLRSRYNIPTLTETQACIGTALAVWKFTNGTEPYRVDKTLRDSIWSGQHRANIEALFDALVAGAEAAALGNPPVYEPSVTVAFDAASAVEDSGWYGPITVTAEKDPPDFTQQSLPVTLTSGYPISLNSSHTGPEYSKSVPSGTEFYVNIGAGSAAEVVKATATVTCVVGGSTEDTQIFAWNTDGQSKFDLPVNLTGQPLVGIGAGANCEATITGEAVLRGSPDGLTFVNSYTPPPAPPIEITVHKHVFGMEDCEEAFSFTLTQMDMDDSGEEPVYTETDGGVTLPLTIVGEGADSFVLEGLTPGTYWFRITEDGADAPPKHWDYDIREHIVEVEISIVDEEFVIVVHYPSGGATFNNFFDGAIFEFLFNKTDEHGEPMDGAQFKLYACGDPEHAGIEDGDHDPLGEGSCWEWRQTAVSGGEIEGLEEEYVPGRVLFMELANGLYLLAETATLPGYQLPHAQWLVRITDGAVDITAFGGTPPGFMWNNEDGELYVANYRTLRLPMAGSFSMLLFSAGGVMLLAGAVALAAGGLRAGKKKKEG